MADTIPALFEEAVEANPSKVWLVSENATFSYADALVGIERAASALHDLDVRRATHVLATMRNTPDYLFLWFAVCRLGATIITVNPESTGAELTGIARQVRPRIVVTDDGLFPIVGDALADAGTEAEVVRVQDLFARSGDGAVPSRGVHPDDVAVMIPTSGTTGRSKLVMQTHRAYVMAGEGFPWWMGLTSEDRLMTTLPLFHINAPAYSTLGSVAARASLVLLPRFSASRFLEWARKYEATEFNSIGAMIEILMRQPKRPDDADTPLRLCYTGPSPPKERQLEIEQRFGLEIICGYALSESPYGLIWRHGTRPYGTLGSARQHPVLGHVNDARVLEEGRPAPVGAVGELELRNPAITPGYHGMADETRKTIVDGWLRTGDLVRVNADETYTFIGRKKEVIRRRGENLSPAEVEAALESHPDVAEAAVIGVPSELSEEDVKAFVVACAGATPQPLELKEFISKRLASFKVPRYYEIVSELPHTPTGRLAKHKLPRERTSDEIDAEEPR